MNECFCENSNDQNTTRFTKKKDQMCVKGHLCRLKKPFNLFNEF